MAACDFAVGWLCLMPYMWLLIMYLYSPVFSSQMDIALDCSTINNLCNINKLDDIIEVETHVSCGDCTLQVNTTTNLGIQLQLDTLPTWSVFNYFYITSNQHRQFWGYTGTAHNKTCNLMFPHHGLGIHFHATSNLTFGSYSHNLTCLSAVLDETSGDKCYPIHNCTSLQSFKDIHRMTYQEELTFFDTDHLHPNLFKWYGLYEFKAYPPMCPIGCRCTLQFQVMNVYCRKQESKILLIQTELTNRTYRAVMDFTRQQLTDISPQSFHGLSQIGRVTLNKNYLTSIQSGTFLGLESMVVLEIADNELQEIAGDAFDDLRLLLFVGLNKNKLQSIRPGTLKNQAILLGLDMSDNYLTELPSDIFAGFLTLHIFLVDRNNLTTLQPNMFDYPGLARLWWLYLDDNNLNQILPGTFTGLDELYRLHLNGNNLSVLEPGIFVDIPTLYDLTLSRNHLHDLQGDAFQGLDTLYLLELEDNNIRHLDFNIFTTLEELILLQLANNEIDALDFPKHSAEDISMILLPRLKILELTNNSIDKINGDILEKMPNLKVFHLRNNGLKKVDKTSFQKLANKTIVLVDEPATCCFINSAECKATNPRAPYLTCQRLLPNTALQIFMWIFGLASFLGNTSVLLWRCVKRGRENIIQVLLIENLAASDLLMGVYMLIIASADAHYQQYFPSEAEYWRNGIACKIAGTISVLSSEASVFIVTLISIDRYLAIKYPSGKNRFTNKSATFALASIWILALILSIIPTSISGINPNFYDVSEVCIGLPFVRSFIYLNNTAQVELEFDFNDYDYEHISSTNARLFEGKYLFPENGNSPGLYFSIALFLGLNFLCFLTVAASYIAIFVLFKQTAGRMGKSRKDQEISLAIRMGAIVLTDFCCWMPIILIGILVQAAVVDVSPVVYVYIVVFILPINSAVNPYIYTIATVLSDRKQKKASSAKTDSNSSRKSILKLKTSSTNDTSVSSNQGISNAGSTNESGN